MLQLRASGFQLGTGGACDMRGLVVEVQGSGVSRLTWGVHGFGFFGGLSLARHFRVQS